MIITQESLIKQVADQENVDAVTIRNIFKSAENIVFDCLSSTTPSETVIIKLFSGITLERKYIKKKTYSKGMFQNIDCDDHIIVKANSSKYYSKKVNNQLFEKNN